jgi:hypothetical protein
MPEIYLSPINTVPVAAAATGAEESYIRQAVADGRLPSQPGNGGIEVVSFDQVRALMRTDGLRI